MQRFYETSTDTTVGPVFASVTNPASSDLDFSILSEYLWEEGDMQDSTKLLDITESEELNCFLSPDHEISSGGRTVYSIYGYVSHWFVFLRWV